MPLHGSLDHPTLGRLTFKIEPLGLIDMDERNPDCDCTCCSFTRYVIIDAAVWLHGVETKGQC